MKSSEYTTRAREFNGRLASPGSTGPGSFLGARGTEARTQDTARREGTRRAYPTYRDTVDAMGKEDESD
jgi:hypothetical protein